MRWGVLFSLEQGQAHYNKFTKGNPYKQTQQELDFFGGSVVKFMGWKMLCVYKKCAAGSTRCF